MKIIFKQIIIIITLSIVLGLLRIALIEDENFKLIKLEKPLVNTMVISNIEDCIVDASKEMKEPLAMPIECVKYNFDQNNAVIIDARSKEEYDESHIKNSINISYDSYDEFIFKEDGVWFLEKNYRELLFEQIYIIYCNGGDCPLSEDLAILMYEFGFKMVFIYEEGLPEWIENVYPVE